MTDKWIPVSEQMVWRKNKMKKYELTGETKEIGVKTLD